MKYKYFVSYFCNKLDIGQYSLGSCEAERKNEIKSYDDIEEIAKEIENVIKDNTNLENVQVIILNYKKLE